MSLVFKPRSNRLLVYILGWGRSGSSVLANILGSLPGSASLGEARYLWDRGIAENGICGCGEAFSDCEFWPGLKFGGTPLGQVGETDALALAKSIGSLARLEQIPAMLNAGARARYFRNNSDALEALAGVYNDAFVASDGRYLIDASKSPYYAVNFLRDSIDYDVAFLHLVRDPRAVLYSWKKKKKRGDSSDDRLFPQYSSTRSLLQWSVVNASCERFGKLAPNNYFRIRYEDFAADWRSALAQGAPDLFELQSKPACPQAAEVAAQHSISGNPSRFDLGEINLKTDTAWQEAVTTKDRVLAKAICGSVARRYGYETH